MSAPSTLERFRPHGVPLVVSAIVAVAVLIVPPLVLGEMTGRTYALTAAVIILAVGAVLPYAVLVAVGTLPLLYTGIASYAAPRASQEDAHQFSAGTALRHVVGGVAYVLGAAVVGAIGIGVQFAVRSDASTDLTGPATNVPAVPSFLFLGGIIVAIAFVGLQLWRYDTPTGRLDGGRILGTAALGGLLALSPVVAFWVFGGLL